MALITKTSDLNWLLVTITFCLTVLIFGGLMIERLTPDVNYHPPTQQEKLAQCIRDTPGSVDQLRDTCKKVAGIQ